MTGKVNPNNDEARRIASELVKKQQAQRVQELEAVDPDQKAKQQQFRSFMQPSDDENDAPPVAPTSPSPLQPSFYSNSTKNSGIDPKLAMPSPAYSPTPNINNMPQDSFNILPEDPLSDAGLPESPAYYESTELPWQAMNSPDFQEEQSAQGQIPGQAGSQTSQTDSQSKEAANKNKPGHLSDSLNRGPAAISQRGKDLDANPFGLTGKPTASQLSNTHAAAKKEGAQTSKKEGDPSAQPSSRFWNEEAVQNNAASSLLNRKGGDKKITGTTKTGDIDTHLENKKGAPKPFEPILESAKDQPAHEESKSKGRDSKKETADSSGPNQTSNQAPQFQGTADAAAVAPTPYARPELAQLFCQTVGTIILTKMPSGISKTEFVLNNPRFANSRFAGATIEITRYSTAPDALNIRISGSPEAVNAFNQSKDSLMATFQNGYDAGNFKFQITRIDVDQASSKPVFHRREKGEDQGGSDQEGRRK